MFCFVCFDIVVEFIVVEEEATGPCQQAEENMALLADKQLQLYTLILSLSFGENKLVTDRCRFGGLTVTFALLALQ